MTAMTLVNGRPADPFRRLIGSLKDQLGVRFGFAKVYGATRRDRGWLVMKNDRAYFMRRAAQERSAATITQGKAREAHEAMARHYQELVQAADPTKTEPAEATR
jgi:hypothetical protein